MRFAARVSALVLLSCVVVSAQDAPEPERSGAVELVVAEVLDAFHLAAADADGEQYFGLFAPDAVFLGTDASERWSVSEFRAFAEPYFSAGRGWTYVASQRHVTVDKGGQIAWFDERLQNLAYGEVRGSGVLRRLDGEWRIAQYNLTIPVPNQLAGGLIQDIRAAREFGEVQMSEHRLALGSGDGEAAELRCQEYSCPVPDGEPTAGRPVVLLIAPGGEDAPPDVEVLGEALARRGMVVFVAEPSAPPRLAALIERISELRREAKVVLVGLWGCGRGLCEQAEADASRIRGVALCGFPVGENATSGSGTPLLSIYAQRGPLISAADGLRNARAFYRRHDGPKHWVSLPGEAHRLGLTAADPLLQLCLAGWIEQLPR